MHANIPQHNEKMCLLYHSLNGLYRTSKIKYLQTQQVPDKILLYNLHPKRNGIYVITCFFFCMIYYQTWKCHL